MNPCVHRPSKKRSLSPCRATAAAPRRTIICQCTYLPIWAARLKSVAAPCFSVKSREQRSSYSIVGLLRRFSSVSAAVQSVPDTDQPERLHQTAYLAPLLCVTSRCFSSSVSHVHILSILCFRFVCFRSLSSPARHGRALSVKPDAQVTPRQT
jgi:hypothetical protein